MKNLTPFLLKKIIYKILNSRDSDQLVLLHR